MTTFFHAIKGKSQIIFLYVDVFFEMKRVEIHTIKFKNIIILFMFMSTSLNLNKKIKRKRVATIQES